MKIIDNPFTIAFGKEPYTIVSRDNDLKEIYSSFSSDHPESDVYILTGIRESGKTVLSLSGENRGNLAGRRGAVIFNRPGKSLMCIAI